MLNCYFVEGNKECPKVCPAHESTLTLEAMYYVQEELVSDIKGKSKNEFEVLDRVLKDNDIQRIGKEERKLENQIRPKCIYLNPALTRLIPDRNSKAS